MTLIKDKYRIVFDPNDSKKWVVELLPPCAPFNGILYSYGEFGPVEPTSENSDPRISFQTEVIYVPDHLKGKTFPNSVSVEMDKLLAQILIDIIDTYGDKAKNQDGKMYIELVQDDKR
jgi:hypothetical protein